MKRSSFIKSLLVMAIAPKTIAEVVKTIPAPPLVSAGTSSLFNDLNLLAPQYLPKMMEKYGNSDFTFFMEQMRKEAITSSDTIKFTNYETHNSSISTI